MGVKVRNLTCDFIQAFMLIMGKDNFKNKSIEELTKPTELQEIADILAKALLRIKSRESYQNDRQFESQSGINTKNDKTF